MSTLILQYYYAVIFLWKWTHDEIAEITKTQSQTTLIYILISNFVGLEYVSTK